MRFVLADQFRANRIATFCQRPHATLSLMDQVAAVRFGNLSFPVEHLR
jgi:hypothetical protein